MRKTNKKGQVLGNFGAIGVGIAVLAITLVIAFLVMSQASSQINDIEGITCNASEQTSYACNSTKELQNATSTVPGWVPLIVIVAIGGTVLAMVKKFQ